MFQHFCLESSWKNFAIKVNFTVPRKLILFANISCQSCTFVTLPLLKIKVNFLNVIVVVVNTKRCKILLSKFSSHVVDKIDIHGSIVDSLYCTPDCYFDFFSLLFVLNKNICPNS